MIDLVRTREDLATQRVIEDRALCVVHVPGKGGRRRRDIQHAHMRSFRNERSDEPPADKSGPTRHDGHLLAHCSTPLGTSHIARP